MSMSFTKLKVALLFGCAALCLNAGAQEGHPLSGSWIGSWGPSETHGNLLIVVMDWADDGENITGVINPGIDNMALDSVILDAEEWVVRLEARRTDNAGNTLNYVLEGQIRNLAFPSRYIQGTWRHESEEGEFEIRRQ
jgi:hypothetical protein